MRAVTTAYVQVSIGSLAHGHCGRIKAHDELDSTILVVGCRVRLRMHCCRIPSPMLDRLCSYEVGCSHLQKWMVHQYLC